MWRTFSQVTEWFNGRRPVGGTLTAVAQSALEAITMDTGVGDGVVEGVKGECAKWRTRRTCSADEKAKTRWILLWIFHLTCTPSPPVSNWNRQWRVRHASATAIGRLMRWHQAREWLIGLMRITVSKCFFIPLWLAMQQICYLYSRLWWITQTHGLGVRRAQS